MLSLENMKIDIKKNNINNILLFFTFNSFLIIDRLSDEVKDINIIQNNTEKFWTFFIKFNIFIFLSTMYDG